MNTAKLVVFRHKGQGDEWSDWQDTPYVIESVKGLFQDADYSPTVTIKDHGGKAQWKFKR